MKITKRNFENLVLTSEERKAFEVVANIIADFDSAYSADSIYKSEITGEVVSQAELARVRGVLGFFSAPYQIYSVEEPEVEEDEPTLEDFEEFVRQCLESSTYPKYKEF